MKSKESTLLGYKSKIKWSDSKSMAFSPGFAINSVIKRYKIPAKKWGYSGSIIGVETNKQFMFWKDSGYSLEFKGLLNK